MAASNTHTTVANLEKAYKKTATPMYKAFKDSVDEFSWLDDVQDEEITVSGRENLIPLDIRRGYGASSVVDGGYEARTITPGMAEGSFSPVQFNARFFISRLAQAYDEHSRAQQFKSQLRYQSKKSLEALSRKVGLNFYGFSTGTVAINSTAATATTQTLTLRDAFGVSTLDDTTYLSSLFEVGDRIALQSTVGTLVTNALGEITVNSAGVLTVVFDGSVVAASGQLITFANTVTDATVTATDANRWTTGLLDMLTSSSVHGLATSSEPNWAAALANTSGGRFSAAKLKKMRQAIANKGGGTLTDLILAQGVENDIEESERAARIYNSSAFDLDQSVKAKGVKIRSSELVPNGMAIGFDKSAIAKKLLTDKPAESGSLAWGDLHKAEDRSGWKGGYDFIWAMVCRSRGKLAYYSALTEA